VSLVTVFVLLAINVAVGMAAIAYYLYLKAHRLARDADDFSGEDRNVLGQQVGSERLVIAVHTYKPPHGVIPRRGRLVALEAKFMVDIFECPVLLAVGRTVRHETRTEAEIYRDYLYEIDQKIKFIFGEKDEVRDTKSETEEMFRLCQVYDFNHVLVLGAWPHLGSRIIDYWQAVNQDQKLRVEFIGVKIPFYFYWWEALMWLAEKIIPPGSRRRQLVLDVSGRRG